MAEYYNVTTNLGDAEIANAIATNTKLNITHVAFGDGNGSVPTPNKARTSLVREVHRQAVTKYERHATNANWIVIETIIPSGVGGFTIREMGIIANGKLISYGSHAPFEKVADPSGVSEYRLRFTQNVTDGSVVEIMLDESLIYASQEWVKENFIKRSEIVDNLITDDPAKPISARQAKILNEKMLEGLFENDSPIDRTNQRHPNITYTNPSDKRYMLIYLDIELTQSNQTPGIIFIDESEVFTFWGGANLNSTLVIPPKGTIKIQVNEHQVEFFSILSWREM
ncbi:phage tail protein [Acinetobacter towneri]|uniref:phage tail protein n=1 Tax=Acinetobacter towneri TaxID=202956 RepID=UPI001CE1F444|nr:phage tail protein [Acinetobacter towneri]MCA4779752.1 phage tail protein [Acinetobacter towneri]MCA4784913.1 phage tail protein [Acinetobacter towneri]MCA4788079.1 phage tail protein [Acinetobacter towneri]MCA4796053.1 phage tail protein [Acinetobacter towneri]MCA4801264.1 phage tail protein [Acinetobacter towneri]